ncbi:MAG: radical SAM protein [Lachnospiraceae bacterium]
MSFLILWTKSSTVRHISYHFSQLAEVKNYLKQNIGNQITILDMDVENIDLLTLADIIIKKKIQAVACYVSTENLRSSFEAAMFIKHIDPQIKLLAYGRMPCLLPEYFVKSEFDAVCFSGDKELAIKDYFMAVKKKTETNSISGIAHLCDKKLIYGPVGKYLPGDKWGVPELDTDIPFETYFSIKKKRRITITISRGCPFDCPHCLIPITAGHQERRRDLTVLKKYLHTIYKNVNYIKLYSPNFTLNKKYVYTFCNIIKSDFPEMQWECTTRVDLLDDNLLIETMAKSGCKQITLGIESINEIDLNNVNKKHLYNFQKLDKIINLMNDNKIKLKACIMIGMPTQTKESVYNTIDYLVKKGSVIRPTIYTPYQDLNCNMSISDIEQYNRKTLYDNSSELSYKQQLQLVTNVMNYQSILK